ncbi:hypothetical protein EMCRGX_G028274 [Ephydatia muelleri]
METSTTTLDWLQSNREYDLMLGDLVLEQKVVEHRAIVSQESSLLNSGGYIELNCVSSQSGVDDKYGYPPTLQWSHQGSSHQNWCLQDLFKQINITISPTKIFSVFAVSLSEVQESVEGFNNCLYHSLLEPTVEVIEKCCGEILELLLPILANSWKQQRGEMFEFGEESYDPMMIRNLDQEKLTNAPVQECFTSACVKLTKTPTHA